MHHSQIKRGRNEAEQPDSGQALRGYLLLVGLTLFWGLTWPAIKVVVQELSPWVYRAVSVTPGGLGILALCSLRGIPIAIPRRELLPLILVALLNVTGWQLFSAFGTSLMPAGRAVIVGFTMPLWATLLGAWLLREPLSVAKVGGLILGLAGLAVLMWQDILAIGAAPLGCFLMLTAAVSWGAGTVLIKRFTWSMPMLLLVGWQLTLGCVPLIAGAMLFDNGWDGLVRLSWLAIGGIVYTVIFPMWFCYWAYFTVVRIFSASKAALSTLAIPVIGVISSALILGEPLGAAEVISLLMVLLSLTLIHGKTA